MKARNDRVLLVVEDDEGLQRQLKWGAFRYFKSYHR